MKADKIAYTVKSRKNLRRYLVWFKDNKTPIVLKSFLVPIKGTALKTTQPKVYP